MRNVYRFGNKGKLSPRYVGPFQKLKRVSPLAYKIEMPPNLAGVHDVFHVSQLRKCVHDPSQVISHEPLGTYGLKTLFFAPRASIRITDGT
jgi:hypothetical protein